MLTPLQPHSPLLPTLERWHHQLRQGDQRWQLELQHVEQHLARDPIAPLRRQALQLLRRLSEAPPGETELEAAARLWRGWGDVVAIAFPSLARYHYEQAWEARPQAAGQLGLGERLALLAHRQGLEAGAWALEQTPPTRSPRDAPPWYELPCSGLGCGDCQEALQRQPNQCPQHTALELTELPEGRIWCDRFNPWAETYGVAVAAADGELQPSFCRCFPWSWPGCQHEAVRDALTLEQLAWRQRQLPQPQRLDGAVLAVADLSAELYYHFQLELLPRLGTAWRQLSGSEPRLRLWHNGGTSPRVRDALQQLGIPEDRLLDVEAIPHLQAERLWLASWPAPFGAPGPWVVPWLRQLYGVEPPAAATGDRVLWLPRGAASRRPLLQEQAWIEALQAPLAARGLVLEQADPQTDIRSQWQQISTARCVIAPHGGAMVNLVAGPPGSALLELVNPGYAPPYFATTLAATGISRWGHAGRATADPLARLLYSGPLEQPIDLGPPHGAQLQTLLSLIDP